MAACGDDASGEPGAGTGVTGGASGTGTTGGVGGGAASGTGGTASGTGGAMVMTGGTGAGGSAGTGASGTSGSDAGSAGACDLTGSWIVKRVLFTTPNSALAPGAQKVSNWDLYEIEQSGDDFTVTSHLMAGIVTTGDARVSLSDATLGALQEHMDHTGRRGTFKPTADGCAFTLERTYAVMGVNPIAFYRGGVADPPGRIAGNPDAATLEPLPSQGGNPGADDWDGDGKPGIQFVITDSPLGSGVRHETQRDWQEMSGTVAASSDEFEVPVTWNFEETVVEASNPFFGVVASVREGAPHTAFWKRTDASIRGATDVETAKNMQAAMPHEPLPRDAL